MRKEQDNFIPQLRSEHTIRGIFHVDPVSEINYRFLHHFKEVYPYTHDHDFYEIFLVLEGKCFHLVNDRKMLISKGQIVFIRPRDIHKFEKHSDQEFNAINLAFLKKNLDLLKKYFENDAEFNKLSEAPLPPLITLRNEQLLRILHQTEQLHTTPHDNRGLIRLRLKSLLVEVFLHFFDRNAVQIISSRPIWLEKLLLEINQPANFTQGLTRLIELSCKSQEHVTRVFQTYLNTTPSSYIRDLQLTYASNLLLHSNKHIAEIALSAGYENINYFYRSFTKRFGLPPGKFRTENMGAPH